MNSRRQHLIPRPPSNPTQVGPNDPRMEASLRGFVFGRYFYFSGFYFRRSLPAGQGWMM